jgi:hypothetical protein
MNVYNIQHSITEQLTAGFTSVSSPVLAFDLPDNPNDFQKAVTTPIAYVVYTGSKADSSNSTRVVTQRRKLSFTVEVHARSLYAANGLHTTRDLVEQILIGWAPLNCQRLYLIKDDIDKTDDGIWVHMLQFECETMLVQVADDDPIVVPILKCITNTP